MNLTNKLNLPQPIVDAVKNDSYYDGGANISITGLLRPPRIRVLENSNKAELTEDASDRIWALLGQVIHGILERASTTGTAERRLFISVAGWKVSGSMDRYVDGTLQDYKFVTAYKLIRGVPEEYEQQLNCYAELLRQHKEPINKLELVCILRDWSKTEAAKDFSYPQQQIMIVPVPLWSQDKTINFIEERVATHQAAETNLPNCSKEERWAKDSVWATMKPGRASAVKLHKTEDEAKAHAASIPTAYVDHRPGINMRCEYYCPVSKFCTQYKKLKGDK